MEERTTRSRGSGRGLLAVRAPAAGEQRQTGAGLNQSADWAEPLQQLALALVRSVSLDDVAAAIVAYGTVAAGARWSHVLLFDGHGAPGVSLLAGPGVPSCRLDTTDLGAPSPWNDALRQARQLTFPSTDALLQAYPELKPLLALKTQGPVVTTPLVVVDDRCGAVTFGFDDPPVEGGEAAGTAPLDTIAELSGRAAVRAAVYAGEHQSAELLQRAYLPTGLSPLGDVSFASRYLPAGEPVGVGGDWYDLFPLPDGRIGVVMGDVAGHGLQAAVVMASLRGALRAFSTVEACPAGILSRLNDFTCLFKPDAFATAFVGLFDAGQERIRYARAGHPPPLLVARDGSTEVLNGALGPPLGFPGATYEPGEEAFPVGTSLVAYTDGLIERRGESLESRLTDLVAAAQAGAVAGPEELCDRLVFDLLAGHDLADDAALLVATRQDPAR